MDHPAPPSTPKPSNDWSPFTSRAHFRFAEFTYKKTEMSKANTNKLIEIWEDLAGQSGGERPFRNVQDILNIIDAIDLGHVPWETFSLEYPGELPDFNPVRATLSLCEFASEAMSTLGCRRLTYPRVSSGLPFLPNKPRALVAKRRGG